MTEKPQNPAITAEKKSKKRGKKAKRKKTSAEKEIEKKDHKLIDRLTRAFSRGYNVTEAILYAKTSAKTFYKKFPVGGGRYKQFMQLQNHPRIKAKETIFNNLDKPSVAIWFAEHKMSDEFSKKEVVITDPEYSVMSDEDKEILRRFQNGEDI